MELDISWEETSVNQLEQPGLKEILRRGIHEALLSGGGREEAEIGLVLVDDKTIGELNKSYRGIDGPTDVLSFAIQEKGEGEPDIIMQDLLEDHQLGYPDSILGDIVVSVERARAQVPGLSSGKLFISRSMVLCTCLDLTTAQTRKQ